MFTSNNASMAEVYTVLFAKTSKEEGALTCITLTVGLVCIAERIRGKLDTFTVVRLVANLSCAKAFCICAGAVPSESQFLTWSRHSEAFSITAYLALMVTGLLEPISEILGQGGVHHGQVTSSLQGQHTETNHHPHSHSHAIKRQNLHSVLCS